MIGHRVNEYRRRVTLSKVIGSMGAESWHPVI